MTSRWRAAVREEGATEWLMLPGRYRTREKADSMACSAAVEAFHRGIRCESAVFCGDRMDHEHGVPRLIAGAN